MSLVRTRLPEHILNPDPEIYKSENYVTLDFETTNVRKGTALDPGNTIVLGCWSLGPDHPGVLPNALIPEGEHAGILRHSTRSRWGGEFQLDDLVRDIEQADFLVCHNAKFELQWLERCGLDIGKTVVWCTQVGEYVIGGNRWRHRQLALDRIAKRRWGLGKATAVSRMIKAGICPSDIPKSWLEYYCKKDVELTERLFLEQLQEMNDKLLAVQFTRCLLTPVLADLEKNGMQLDSDKVIELHEDRERKYADVSHAIGELAHGVNPNSPVQVREYLYETLGFAEVKDYKGDPIRTGTGQKSTAADVVAKLKATTPEQKAFLDHFKVSVGLKSELTKYLRKFRDCVTDAGGLLRAQFNQTNTQTHRLSSSGLDYRTQFQNFPRAYKPVFRARNDGWLMAECDGAQLEFRIAAHLGRCVTALFDIINGTDIHSVTGDIVGVSRQAAKEHTFKPLYGGRSGAPNEVRYYEFFREKYAGITATQQRWINHVLEHKYLETEYGLRYYWPNTRMERSGYVVNSTNICNYPVQGFATAEIIPIGMVYFWHYLRASDDLQMFIVNTVHDSIIAEIPPEEQHAFHVLSRLCLIDEVYTYLHKVYNIDLVVPLGAGVMIGKNWADSEAKASETVYEATEDKYVTV